MAPPATLKEEESKEDTYSNLFITSDRLLRFEQLIIPTTTTTTIKPYSTIIVQMTATLSLFLQEHFNTITTNNSTIADNNKKKLQTDRKSVV